MASTTASTLVSAAGSKAWDTHDTRLIVVTVLGIAIITVLISAFKVGAGSLFLSHVNDAGCWLVSQSFRPSVGQTFKTWSVMECLISAVAFGFISILWVVT